MNSFRKDRKAKYAENDPAMAASLPLRSRRMFAMACILSLAGLAAALVLGHPSALAQPAGPAAQRGNAPAGNVANGRTVFASQQCAVCHGDRGQGGSGPIAGPQIAGFDLTLPDFISVVRKPSDPMPPYAADKLSDATLADVYAFLKSAGPAAPSGAAAPAVTVTAASGNAQAGKQLYVSTGCELCHNGEGQGGAAPRLAPNPNMLSFAAFVHQCRQPSNAMPPYTTKVLSDAQLADIYAYLQTIPKPPAASTIPLLQ